MSRNLMPLSLTASLLAGTAMADAPQVAVDIAPVHSLVARVMEGVGTPALIIQPGASPHEYNLRPSEAQALQDADLVFWMGEDLTPWMEDSIETLAEEAKVVSLLEAEDTELLEFREGALFEAHSHGDEDHDEDHEHEDHGDEEHDHGEEEHDHDDDEHEHDDDDHDHDHAEGDEHDHEDHDDHAHGDHGDHGDHDPHAWLSPDNAASWLNVIAAELSAADPENAGTYYANAAAGQDEIEAASDEVNALLDPVRDGRFIVFHDAYQYFEEAFDISASGAISFSDAADPSPARIAEIQTRIAEENIQCVLSEPQFNAGLVATVMDGVEARTAVLDPLGSDLEPGAALYPQVLRNLAASLAECLS